MSSPNTILSRLIKVSKKYSFILNALFLVTTGVMAVIINESIENATVKNEKQAEYSNIKSFWSGQQNVYLTTRLYINKINKKVDDCRKNAIYMVKISSGDPVSYVENYHGEASSSGKLSKKEIITLLKEKIGYDKSYIDNYSEIILFNYESDIVKNEHIAKSANIKGWNNFAAATAATKEWEKGRPNYCGYYMSKAKKQDKNHACISGIKEMFTNHSYENPPFIPLEKKMIDKNMEIPRTTSTIYLNASTLKKPETGFMKNYLQLSSQQWFAY